MVFNEQMERLSGLNIYAHAHKICPLQRRTYLLTCWATGSNIDSMVFVWNTGIFSAQELIPTPVLAETK